MTLRQASARPDAGGRAPPRTLQLDGRCGLPLAQGPGNCLRLAMAMGSPLPWVGGYAAGARQRRALGYREHVKKACVAERAPGV